MSCMWWIKGMIVYCKFCKDSVELRREGSIYFCNECNSVIAYDYTWSKAK